MRLGRVTWRTLGEHTERLDRIERRGRVALAPLSVANLTAKAGTSAGIIQLSFLVLRIRGVKNIQLLRNLSRDQGTAATLNTWAAAIWDTKPPTVFPLTASYSDSGVPVGTTAYFWLRVVPNEPTLRPVMIGPVKYP